MIFIEKSRSDRFQHSKTTISEKILSKKRTPDERIMNNEIYSCPYCKSDDIDMNKLYDIDEIGCDIERYGIDFSCFGHGFDLAAELETGQIRWNEFYCKSCNSLGAFAYSAKTKKVEIKYKY
jgi:hypothetical protein